MKDRCGIEFWEVCMDNERCWSRGSGALDAPFPFPCQRIVLNGVVLDHGRTGEAVDLVAPHGADRLAHLVEGLVEDHSRGEEGLLVALAGCALRKQRIIIGWTPEVIMRTAAEFGDEFFWRQTPLLT